MLTDFTWADWLRVQDVQYDERILSSWRVKENWLLQDLLDYVPRWLCWKNSSGSAPCSFTSATGVKIHLGTHHCLCQHVLLLSSHSYKPLWPSLNTSIATTKLLRSLLLCYLALCFKLPGLPNNHGYRLILTTWKQSWLLGFWVFLYQLICLVGKNCSWQIRICCCVSSSWF